MSERFSDVLENPGRFDFFLAMRRLERNFADRPRIGDSAARRQEYVTLGQDPYLDFPAFDLRRREGDPDGALRVLVRFLGLLGPQGALPLATTEEAYVLAARRDDAFPRFLDIFNHRFLQLFFRAWADARPIAQHDRPDEDRFRDLYRRDDRHRHAGSSATSTRSPISPSSPSPA